MKKMTVLWLVLALFGLSVLPAMAGGGSEEMVTIRRSILITGEFQRYMPYSFTVTSVNCGVLETMEMKMSHPFFGDVGSWEKKYIGEKAPSGWYHFNVAGADLATCAPVMDIISEVPVWFANSYIGSFMEVEPEDLGLLVKGGTVPKNVFGFSTDDTKYSYELVAMAPGTERELASFIHDTHFFSDTGKGIVGAIISDNRGFLKKKVMFNLNPQPERMIRVPRIHKGAWGRTYKTYDTVTIPAEKFVSSDDNVIVREGDVLVLIRKES